MTQFTLLVSFVDCPEAFVSELSEDSINLLKEKCIEHEEPLKGFNDIIYTLDSEEYVIISDSIQKACYVALCKRINDHLKWKEPAEGQSLSDYMTIAYQQGVNTLLNWEFVQESRITKYITKNF